MADMAQDLETVFEDNMRSLLKVEADGFFDVNVSLVEEATDRDTAVIYVAVKKPYLMLKKELKEQDIGMDVVYFVDCIVRTVTNEKLPQDDEDVLYLKRTDDLRNISTAVSTKAQHASHRDAVLIIDSLAALLATHSTDDVIDFIRDIQERMKTTEMNLVLFDEGRDVEDEIGQILYDIVDNVLFLRGRSP
jgi:KaiC/GvpD/RAD55 family RecA-like ATPase